MSAAMQFESAVSVPPWQFWFIFRLARPLVRVGLWLSVIDFRRSTTSARFSPAKTAVAAGLFGVNVCASMAGAALGWLIKAHRLATRLSPGSSECQGYGFTGQRPFDAVAATARIYATALHDGWRQ
jgi:hypothetical protein